MGGTLPDEYKGCEYVSPNFKPDKIWHSRFGAQTRTLSKMLNPDFRGSRNVTRQRLCISYEPAVNLALSFNQFIICLT